MQADLFSVPKAAKPKPQFSVTTESPDAARAVQGLHYSRHSTPFGDIVIASTTQGICELHFAGEEDILTLLKSRYPNACLEEMATPEHLLAVDCISGEISSSKTLRLHLFGTPFQLKVWDALLNIPAGETCTYGALAARLGLPVSASRAVGTAVGQNPIAVLVPCHRVIGSNGKLTGFRWGVERKQGLLLAEQ